MTLIQTIEKMPRISVVIYAAQDYPTVEDALKANAYSTHDVKSDDEALAMIKGIRIVELIQEQGYMFGAGVLVYDGPDTFDIIRDDRGDE